MFFFLLLLLVMNENSPRQNFRKFLCFFPSSVSSDVVLNSRSINPIDLIILKYLRMPILYSLRHCRINFGFNRTTHRAPNNGQKPKVLLYYRTESRKKRNEYTKKKIPIHLKREKLKV